MDRLNRALAKAGQMAQQYNENVQRAREQQQQQAQQQQNHRLSQQQYYSPPPHQSPYYDRPPPPPPRPSSVYHTPSPSSTPASPPPQATYTRPGDDVARAEAELEQLRQQQRAQLRAAEANVARLRAEQQRQQREAEEQLRAAKIEAESLAASELRRLQAEQEEAERKSSSEQQRLQTEQDRGELEAQRLAQQLEDDRKAAEKLAAEFEAEMRTAEDDMEKMKLAQQEAQTEAPKEEHRPTPPLPPRRAQQPPQPAAAPPSSQPSKPNKSKTPEYRKILPPPVTTPPPQHISGITPTTDCPDSQPLDLNLQYLTHDAAPRFTICTRCYVDYIWDTPFKKSFSLTKFDTREPRGCYFGVPRVKEHLWPAAVQATSLTSFLEYANRRPDVPACPKAAEVKDGDWYQTDDCEGLAICPACYEDKMVGGVFEKNFSMVHLAGGATCDMAVTYVSRMYEKFAPTNDWKEFCTEAYARIRFPPCPKTDAVKGAAWYYPRNGPEGLKVCTGCYCDHFLDTSSENDFLKETNSSKVSCHMGLLNINLLAQEATRRRDQTVWWEGIHEMDRNEFCSRTGTKTDRWYTLPSKPPGFAICGGCMAGIVHPLNASHFFTPTKDIPSHHPFLCVLNPGHSRFFHHLLLILEVVLTGTPDPLATFAHKLGQVAGCPRQHYDKGKKKTWYGWVDAPICEECYVTFAKELHPNPPFQMHGELISDARMCDLYSPRMRRLYKQACLTNDFETFLRLAQERRKIYVECYMPSQQYLIDIKTAAEHANNLGIAGTTYKSMGWTQDVTMGHTYTLGNAAVGYGHVNELCFQGAVYDKQAADVRAQVMDPIKMSQMLALNNMWLAVE